MIDRLRGWWRLAPGWIFLSMPVLAEPVPIWREFNGGHHFYTTSCEEADAAQTLYGFWLEPSPGFIETTQQPGTVPFYRFFGNNEHLYTTSANAEGAAGFANEGVLGYVYQAEAPNLSPLYRSFNNQMGDHFYTTSKTEHEGAIDKYNYASEGVVAYINKQGTQTCSPNTITSPPSPPPRPRPGCSPPGAPACTGGP